MATMDTTGQRHDRIPSSPPGNGNLDAPSSPNLASSAKPTEPEITISQKMMSAVSGSVLTSLLDVVRVRLQSQPSPSPARLPSFIQLPPNLGVSACCREVFWVQNQSQFCVAAPSVPSPANAAVIDEMIISDCAAEETQRRTFNSTLDGLRKISRNEGITTLWRGLSPTLLMSVPGNVIYFAGYDWLRTGTRSPMKGRVNDTYAPLVAGSTARVMAAIVVSPIEMLRTRMQATQTKEKGVMRATLVGLKEMVTNEGYASLWRGLTLTLWRDVPFSALYWWGYEYGRERLHDLRDGSDIYDSALSSPGRPRSRSRGDLSHSAVLTDSFVAGAASGAIASLVTTPFDVGKTRQQTALHKSGVNLKDMPENWSMPRFLMHIFQNEGWTGLFKGWSARCLKVAPACAIMISSYEIGKRMAGTVNERREAAAAEE